MQKIVNALVLLSFIIFRKTLCEILFHQSYLDSLGLIKFSYSERLLILLGLFAGIVKVLAQFSMDRNVKLIYFNIR